MMRHNTATTEPLDLLGEKVRSGVGVACGHVCTDVVEKGSGDRIQVYFYWSISFLQGFEHVKSYKHLLVPPFRYSEMKACLEYYVQEKWISVSCQVAFLTFILVFLLSA